MTAKLINGSEIREEILKEIGQEVKDIKAKYGKVPGLVTILVGSNPASISYVTLKVQTAESLGFHEIQDNQPETISESDLLALIDKYNKDESVNGILVQLPLPKQIDEKKVINAIDPDIGRGIYAWVREGTDIRRGRAGAERLWEGTIAVSQGTLSEPRSLGIEADPSLVRYDLHPAQPGSGWEEFREIWTATVGRPDGLLITDDGLLDEVAATIAELGITVPDQLRVVSLTHATPARALPFPMTLLEVDTATAARILVEILLQQMGRQPTGPASRQIPFVVKQFPPADQRPAVSHRTHRQPVPAGATGA